MRLVQAMTGGVETLKGWRGVLARVTTHNELVAQKFKEDSASERDNSNSIEVKTPHSQRLMSVLLVWNKKEKLHLFKLLVSMVTWVEFVSRHSSLAARVIGMDWIPDRPTTRQLHISIIWTFDL